MKIIFRDTAVTDLWKEVEWGRLTGRNHTEQGGLLVGYFCNAAGEGEPAMPWVEVWHAIPCFYPQISRKDYINMSAENWAEMYNQLDVLNEKKGQNFVSVGWYHTHPQEIPAMYSNLDVQTQGSQFSYKYNIGVVFNPHQRKWMGYYGPESKPCECYLMINDQLAYQYGISRPIRKPVQDQEAVEKTISKTREDQYQILQYEWYYLPPMSRWSRKQEEIVRRSPVYDSHDFTNRLCALSSMLHHNFELMQDMDHALLGMIMTGILKDEAEGYQSIRFIGNVYYHSWNEMLDIEEEGSSGKFAMVVDRKIAGIFEDSNIIRDIMMNLSVDYLILCSPGTDVYENRYGFRIIQR